MEFRWRLYMVKRYVYKSHNNVGLTTHGVEEKFYTDKNRTFGKTNDNGIWIHTWYTYR